MLGRETRDRFVGASESLTASATVHAPPFQSPPGRDRHRADLRLQPGWFRL